VATEHQTFIALPTHSMAVFTIEVQIEPMAQPSTVPPGYACMTPSR
jgi:hypothetical protein